MIKKIKAVIIVAVNRLLEVAIEIVDKFVVLSSKEITRAKEIQIRLIIVNNRFGTENAN